GFSGRDLTNASDDAAEQADDHAPLFAPLERLLYDHGDAGHDVSVAPRALLAADDTVHDEGGIAAQIGQLESLHDSCMRARRQRESTDESNDVGASNRVAFHASL